MKKRHKGHKGPKGHKGHVEQSLVFLMSFLSLRSLGSLLSLWSLSLTAAINIDTNILPKDFLSNLQPEEVQIDLRNPSYCDGVFKTEEGGVIKTPTLRIQAQKITYVRKLDEEVPLLYLEAEGQVLVSYADRLFTGEKISYNFLTKTGQIDRGLASFPPMFAGGECILIHPEGNYEITNGFLTTSPHPDSEEKVLSDEITITDNQHLRASNVRFYFINLPLFWLPSYHTDLCAEWNMPIRYYASWSGKLGPRVGARYQFYKSQCWEGRLFLDYSVHSGMGAGVEVCYDSPCNTRMFKAFNYVGKDKILELPTENTRYRSTAIYEERLPCNVLFHASYDRLSDEYMTEDFDRLASYCPVGLSRVALEQCTQDWTASIQVLGRLNNFQSLMQELPNAAVSFRPLPIFETGIISETNLEAGYLDSRYATELNDTPFSSIRTRASERIYRPFRLARGLKLTPETGFVWLHFGASPNGSNGVDQKVGLLGLNLNASAYKYYGSCKHLMEPYVTVRSTHASATPVTDYYLFEEQDSWLSLQTARVGLRSSLFCSMPCQEDCYCPSRKTFDSDIFTDFFWDRPERNALRTIATGYLSWLATDSLRYTLTGSWDFDRQALRLITFRTDYTFSKDLAVSAEYRHRDAYVWKKADLNNYFLEANHSTAALLASPLSDRRDTLLTNLFWRLTPTMAIKFETLAGWNRIDQPPYFECQADFYVHLRDNWLSRFSFQRRTNDFRFTFHLDLIAKPPYEPCCRPPCSYRGNY